MIDVQLSHWAHLCEYFPIHQRVIQKCMGSGLHHQCLISNQTQLRSTWSLCRLVLVFGITRSCWQWQLDKSSYPEVSSNVANLHESINNSTCFSLRIKTIFVSVVDLVVGWSFTLSIGIIRSVCTGEQCNATQMHWVGKL